MSSFFDELYRSKLNEYKALYSEYELTDEQYIFQREHHQASHMRQNLMASEIFQASKMITVQYMYRNDISAVPVAIFQLRQSIELRILEILGIKGIMDKENCWMKITADSLINSLQIEQGYAFSESFAAIMKIHYWTNFFIHKGFVDNYWLLEFAQHYVKGFIFNTIIADKNFYNDIPKKLSEKLECAVEQIVRSRNPSVKLIEDIDEFKKD